VEPTRHGKDYNFLQSENKMCGQLLMEELKIKVFFFSEHMKMKWDRTKYFLKKITNILQILVILVKDSIGW